jgi:hypothetical protein
MMTKRRTPILLRRAPMSGEVVVVHQYSTNKKGYVRAHDDGKQSVQHEFDHLLLEELIPDPKSDIVATLDGAALGIGLNESERAEIRDFRERLINVITRHNTNL